MLRKRRRNEQNSTKDKFDRSWKEENKRYLQELQKFLDTVDKIADRELRTSITNQMMICDNVLTEIAEDMFINCYNEGCKGPKKIV